MAVRYQSQIDYGQVGRSIEQDLQRAQQFVVAGVETYMDKRLQEQKFANTVLENIESLKEEGDLAHQGVIAGKVDELYNKAKESIYKYRTTKKGKVKFDGFDFDPETLREIKNQARNIKNAALRSEQLRGAYDQGLKIIATDPTVINKTQAIDQLTNAFKNPEILFKGDSINADNPSILFNRIVENNVDIRSAVTATAGQLAGGRTTDVGYTTADGKSEVIQYNIDYYTPQFDKSGKVTGFTANDEALDRLAQQVYSSREGIAGRTSLPEVRKEIETMLSPLSKLRMVEKTPQMVKPTEGDIKRAESVRSYERAVSAFNEVGRAIDRGEEMTDALQAKIQAGVGKDALKNIDFVSLEDIKSDYNTGEGEIIKVLESIDDKDVNKFISEYQGLGSIAKSTTGLRSLIDKVEGELGDSSKYQEALESIEELYTTIEPLQQYVTKDYGILIKDNRGKEKKFKFIESSDDLNNFSTSVFDIPLSIDLQAKKQAVPNF